MTKFRCIKAIAALAAVMFSAAAVRPEADATAPAATQPAATLPATPTVGIKVVDWAVYVTDAQHKELGAQNAYDDVLPPFANDLRHPATGADGGTHPGPLGVIRITAAGATPADPIDVELSYPQGRALGSWPHAKPRARNLLWTDLRLTHTDGELRQLPPQHWLEQLRRSGQPLLVSGTREPFLLYDLELPHPVTLHVTGGDGGVYHVWHTMKEPLTQLTFYKRDAAGQWHMATLSTLAPVATPKPATAPATSTAPATAPRHATRSGPGFMAALAAAITGQPVRVSRPTPAAPSEPPPPPPEPTTAPADASTLTLGPPVATAADALAPWHAALTNAGISPDDQATILQILTQRALSSNRLTAIYAMSPAELEAATRLEVVPEPQKVSRLALVIVTDIDPAIQDEIGDLVTRLGDRSWQIRQDATAALRHLGPAARPALERAQRAKDLEVAMRAERLLQELDHPTPPPG